MTTSAIMKKNVKLLPKSPKDMKIEDYNTDKYYAKRLEKYFSLLKQSSYSEKHRRPSYYLFFDKYNRDKENIFGVSQSILSEDSGIEVFGVSQSIDSGIEEKYVLSEINRIVDKINNKIENMNNKIIALKRKIKELK